MRLDEGDQGAPALAGLVWNPAVAIDPMVRSVAECATDNIMLLDREGVIQYINWTAPGLTPRGVIGTPVLEFVPPSYRQRVVACLERVARTQEPGQYETEYVAPDGDVTWWESRVGALVRAGEVVGFTVVSNNVTERKRAEAERDRFFNLSLDIQAILGEGGHLLRTNPAFERVSGFTAAELTARPFEQLIHPEDRATSRAMIARLLAGEAPLDFENRCVCRDGAYRWIAWRAVGDPHRRLVYGAGRDVTGQKAMEVQLRHAQKMDAVGKLAGGVAHDFNNLLLAIQANAELAEKAADPREHLRDIRLAVGRAASLTGQLLTFSRLAPTNPAPLDLNLVVSELMQMLGRLIPSHIQLVFLPGAELPPVLADRGQLEQVLVNLCVNARDAVPAGGRIEIATRAELLEAPLDRSPAGAGGGRFLVVSVVDDGVGMSPEVQGRLFEPYFTTKDQGKGTGLGLATVYGIVERHRGHLRVESAPGQGARFEVFLPVAGGHVERPPPPGQTDVRGGGETVLVAEDQAMVRRAVTSLLEAAGYRVLSAADGEEALALFERHHDQVALALLDVVMPRLDGPHTFQRLRARAPSLPVLFTSGYNDAQQLAGLLEGSAGVLGKPYPPEELLRRIRSALETSPAR